MQSFLLSKETKEHYPNVVLKFGKKKSNFFGKISELILSITTFICWVNVIFGWNKSLHNMPYNYNRSVHFVAFSTSYLLRRPKSYPTSIKTSLLNHSQQMISKPRGDRIIEVQTPYCLFLTGQLAEAGYKNFLQLCGHNSKLQHSWFTIIPILHFKELSEVLRYLWLFWRISKTHGHKLGFLNPSIESFKVNCLKQYLNKYLRLDRQLRGSEIVLAAAYQVLKRFQPQPSSVAEFVHLQAEIEEKCFWRPIYIKL